MDPLIVLSCVGYNFEQFGAMPRSIGALWFYNYTFRPIFSILDLMQNLALQFLC